MLNKYDLLLKVHIFCYFEFDFVEIVNMIKLVH